MIKLGNVATKLTVVLFALAVVVQYVRIIDRNIVVAAHVNRQEALVRALRAQTSRELQQIARLERPDGAIPEIHERLRLTGPNEAIVYLRHDGDGAAVHTFGPLLP